MWQFLSIFLALIVAATIYHDLMIVTSSMPNWSAESQSLMPRKYFSDASQEGATEQGDILRMYSADAIREMEVRGLVELGLIGRRAGDRERELKNVDTSITAMMATGNSENSTIQQ